MIGIGFVAGATSAIRPKDIVLDDHWAARSVGQINDQLIKIAKLKGEFVWHKHDDENEMFLIVSLHLRIAYETLAVELSAGDLHVVPRGVMHDAEYRIVLSEPASPKHTGDTISERTRRLDDQMGASVDHIFLLSIRSVMHQAYDGLLGT